MGSTGLGGTPWTALTIRAPPVLTKKERHPICTNSPVFKTILTERPRAAVFLRLFRNNLLPFDPDLESIEDVDDYDDEVDGASPNSHKHFFPYMGFCVSIWDNVCHHCHRHHHHHHIQKSKSINTEACLIAH